MKRRKKIVSRKGKVLGYNPHNHDIEVGDKLVNVDNGELYRAEESFGRVKRTSGELYARTIKPPHPGARAVLVPKDGGGFEAFWEWDE